MGRMSRIWLECSQMIYQSPKATDDFINFNDGYAYKEIKKSKCIT